MVLMHCLRGESFSLIKETCDVVTLFVVLFDPGAPFTRDSLGVVTEFWRDGMHVVIVLIEQIVLSALLAVRVLCSIDPVWFCFKGVLILLLLSTSLMLLAKELSPSLLLPISLSSELISDGHNESDVVFEWDEENISVLDVPIESSDMGLIYFVGDTYV